MSKRKIPWQERFVKFFVKGEEDDCWVWNGCKIAKVYGSFNIDGKAVMAHRLSYELFVAPIPEGYKIIHTCNNQSCLNPKHLECVTHLTMMERMQCTRRSTDARRLRTECRNGHVYSMENTLYKDDGLRQCRVCRRIRCRAVRASQRKS